MIIPKIYLLSLLSLLIAVLNVRGGNVVEHDPSVVSATEQDDRMRDPKYFLESNKYYFFPDYLRFSFNITKRSDINLLSGILLQIDANNSNQKILLLDWDKLSDFMEVLVVNGREIVKYKIEDFIWAEDSPTIPVSLLLDFRMDTAELMMNGRAVMINNLDLSVNTGYRFSLLPALSLRPDPNIPPILEISSLDICSRQEPSQKKIWYWLTAIIAIDLLIYIVVILRRMRNRRRLSANGSGAVPTVDSSGDGRTDNFVVGDLPRSGAIYMFGGFYVYAADGENITKQFSPLLRELLSLVIIYSADDGISSVQLKDILWFDKDIKSARNNRAVYLGKLRALLDRVGSYTLSNDTGSWKLSATGIFVDYFEYKKLVWSPSPQQVEIEMLIHTVQHGNLMPDADYRWMDTYKADVADTVIEHLCNYSKSLRIEKSPDFSIALADTIFRFDHLNEQALYLKCKAYNSSGRHSSAKKTYDLFTHEYREIYDSNFQYEFTDVLNLRAGEDSESP